MTLQLPQHRQTVTRRARRKLVEQLEVTHIKSEACTRETQDTGDSTPEFPEVTYLGPSFQGPGC